MFLLSLALANLARLPYCRHLAWVVRLATMAVERPCAKRFEQQAEQLQLAISTGVGCLSGTSARQPEIRGQCMPSRAAFPQAERLLRLQLGHSSGRQQPRLALRETRKFVEREQHWLVRRTARPRTGRGLLAEALPGWGSPALPVVLRLGPGAVPGVPLRRTAARAWLR